MVTGGSGFIGTHLSAELSKRNVELVISGTKEIKKSNYIKADITKKDEVSRLVGDVDCVIHLAALSLGDSRKNPELGVRINVNGTLNLLEECVKKGVGTLNLPELLICWAVATRIHLIKDNQQVGWVKRFFFTPPAVLRICNLRPRSEAKRR